MSIYNTAHVPSPPVVGSSGDAGACSSSSSSSSSSAQVQVQAQAQPPPPLSSSPEEGTVTKSKRRRRRSFPFSFAPGFLFQSSSSSSTEVVPSTAEGKAISLVGDNNSTTTAGHRTSSAAALQKLNSTYPSSSASIDPRHHGYAKSTGAQSSTYSQPVIVRTYSGQSHSRNQQRRQPSHGRSGRVPLQPTTAQTSNNGDEMTAMPHQFSSSKSKPRLLPWSWMGYDTPQEAEEEVKLPPLEAFSFKNFINDTGSAATEQQQQRQPQNDISADLDRIAEICARSRYSLSNQYEVHVAPHGSGASFTSQKRGRVVPLLPDGEDSSSGRQRRGNGAARRKSVAYGTLETIMSSSRSCSEEGGDSQKKKGAKEVVDEVRGRAGGRTTHKNGSVQEGESSKKKRLERKKSTSFANAIMDSSLGSGAGGGSREEGLLSEIALPRVSASHLAVRTSSSSSSAAAAAAGGLEERRPRRRLVAEELPPEEDEEEEGQQGFYMYQGQNPRMSSSGSGLFGGWMMPWQSQPLPPPSHGRRRNSRGGAEGRLRELLRAPPSEGRR